MTKCTTASDILAPYEATATSLEDAEPLYAVNIEFKGQDSSLLRLEAEFAKSPASGLFEVSQKRWIRPQDEKFGDKRPPLQVGVIDFERYALLFSGISTQQSDKHILGLIGSWKLRPWSSRSRQVLNNRSGHSLILYNLAPENPIVYKVKESAELPFPTLSLFLGWLRKQHYDIG